MSKTWRLRLADQVELDLRDIVAWTADHFGPRQADGYLETVTRAIEALHDSMDLERHLPLSEDRP